MIANIKSKRLKVHYLKIYTLNSVVTLGIFDIKYINVKVVGNDIQLGFNCLNFRTGGILQPVSKIECLSRKSVLLHQVTLSNFNIVNDFKDFQSIINTIYKQSKRFILVKNNNLNVYGLYKST
jgi:hypothetical protein